MDARPASSPLTVSRQGSRPLVALVRKPFARDRGLWHDALGHWHIAHASSRRLTLQGALPPGHYALQLMTRPGIFPMDTLNLALTEWPSRRTVACGPFDFDHQRYRMVVPCFELSVDDQPAGLAWFDVPSHQQVQQRSMATQLGFQLNADGLHTLTLTLPPAETRLNWHDLAVIQISEDARQPVRTPIANGADLWAGHDAWDQLQHTPTALQRTLLDSLEHSARSGFARTYSYRLILLALLHRTGRCGFDGELTRLVQALLARPHWGFHDREGEMGCDNDRDTGMRLMEAATVLQWAPAAMDDATRQALRSRIRRHAAAMHRFSVLQKSYWPDTTVDAHGLGSWLGLATAAVVLRDEPQARIWLDWCYGNFLRNATLLPGDGYGMWTEFNFAWAVYLLALFESLAGQRLAEDCPFFHHYADALWQQVGLRDGGGDGKHRNTFHAFLAPMTYLANRNRRDDLLAAAARRVQLAAQRGNHLPPMLLLWMPPQATSSTPPPRRLRTCRGEHGWVRTQAQAGDRTIGLSLTCGSPFGPHMHRLNRYAQFFHNPNFTGDYRLRLDGRCLIGGPTATYQIRVRNHQMLSINGGGHRCEGRYGGTLLAMNDLPRIRHLHDDEHWLYLQADLRNAYQDELPLVRVVRHVLVWRDAGVVVVADDLLAHTPVHVAHHLNSPGHFEHEAESLWRVRPASDADAPAADRWLGMHGLMPDGCTASCEPTQYVPTYGDGLNGYKTRDWQPEVQARHAQPPDFQQLTHRAEDPVERFTAAVVYAPMRIAARAERHDSCLHVRVVHGENELALKLDPDAGLTPPDFAAHASQDNCSMFAGLATLREGDCTRAIWWDTLEASAMLETFATAERCNSRMPPVAVGSLSK